MRKLIYKTSAMSLFMILSCSKSTETASPTKAEATSTTSTKLVVVEDRIKFSKSTDLKDFMENIMPDSEMVKQGFVSYFVAKDESNAAGARKETDPEVIKDTNYIADPSLARILNKKREIQVGDSIYKVGEDFTFFFKKGDESMVDMFYKDLEAGQISIEEDKLMNYKSIQVFKTFQSVKTATSKPTVSISGADLRTEGYLQDFIFANLVSMGVSIRYRMQCELWSTNAFFYSGCGVSTKIQSSLNNGTWADGQTNDLSVSGDGSFDIYVRCGSGQGCLTGACQQAGSKVVNTEGKSLSIVKRHFNQMYGFALSSLAVCYARTTHTAGAGGKRISVYLEGNDYR